ncbi:hypothetical protein [Streptomyces sp. NPDC017991]
MMRPRPVAEVTTDAVIRGLPAAVVDRTAARPDLAAGVSAASSATPAAD